MQEIQQKQQNLWKYAWKAKNKTVLVAPQDLEYATDEVATLISLDQYKSTKKSNAPKIRLYKTRENPFEDVKNEIILRLELSPNITAKDILESLMKMEPNKYKMNQLRTLQRYVAGWRKQQWHKMNLDIFNQETVGNLQDNFSSLVSTRNSLNSISKPTE